MYIKIILKYVLSGFLLVAGLGVVAGMSVLILSKNQEHARQGFAALLVLLGVVPFITGWWLLRKTSKQSREFQERRLQVRIMELALQKRGMLTVPEVAMKLRISIDEAEQRLVYLQNKGVFELQLTDNGIIVFQLLNYNTLEDKQKAHQLFF